MRDEEYALIVDGSPMQFRGTDTIRLVSPATSTRARWPQVWPVSADWRSVALRSA